MSGLSRGWPADVAAGCPSCDGPSTFIHGTGHGSGRACDRCGVTWDAEELGWAIARALVVQVTP